MLEKSKILFVMESSITPAVILYTVREKSTKTTKHQHIYWHENTVFLSENKYIGYWFVYWQTNRLHNSVLNRNINGLIFKYAHFYSRLSFNTFIPLYTVPKIIDFPPYNMKCSGKTRNYAEYFMLYLVFLYISCYIAGIWITLWTE